MIDKHQPCGVPGCLNCAPPPMGYMGQAQMRQSLLMTEHEQTLEALSNSHIARLEAENTSLRLRLKHAEDERLARFQADLINTMNSPWAQLREDIETQGHVARHATDQQALNKRYAELSAAAEKIKGKGTTPEMFDDFGSEFTKYILRQLAYFLLVMLAVGAGFWWFL